MMRIVLVLFVLALGVPDIAFSQDAQTIRITHKFNWRRWVDDKYQGLVYGHLLGAWKLTPGPQAGWQDVEARYQLASESRRDNALTEKPISSELQARFRIDPKGNASGFEGDGVPLYRNFPGPLPSDVSPGTHWTGTGFLVSDFLGTGTTTRIPILVDYQLLGPADYFGTPVIQVRTQYALRYRAGDDPSGDPTLAKGEGTHVGTVTYDQSSHRVLLIRETAQESFWTTKGNTRRNDGILLTFLEGMPVLQTETLVKSLKETLDEKLRPDPQTDPAKPLAPDVKVEADPRGVKLTLENLRFVADQAVLLPGEDTRLATISDLLKTVPTRNLLVIGHTANVGTQESQDQLSVDRALAIVEKLKAAGIPPQRLLYEGRGGREPVTSNATEAGRAQNRRVEIVILDQ